MAERLSERRYRGLPPEVRQADRQRRFREAGLDVFSSTGYMGCSVPEICRVAGLSTRQFYEEFPSREGLLKDLLGRVHSEARSVFAQSVRAAADEGPEQSMVAGVTAYLHALADDPRKARVALRESVGVSVAVDRVRDRELAEWSVLVEDLARRAFGLDRTPAGRYRTAMIACTGALNAVVLDWSGGEPRAPISEVVEVLLPLLRAMFGVDPAAG